MSHFLIGTQEAEPQNPANQPAAGATHELVRLKEALTQSGYMPTCAIGFLGALAGLVYAVNANSQVELWPSALLLLASMLAAAHGWDAGRQRDSVSLSLVRHRLVLGVFGAACASATMQWIDLPAPNAPAWVAAFVLLQAGFGVAAAAADRVCLIVWLLTVVALPSASILMFGDTESRHVGLPLMATSVVVLLMAGRIRQMLTQSMQVREDNDLLVAQLRKQVALVEAANAEKSRFLGAASHDLRQPMHALGLFASALERDLRSTAHYPNVISMVRAVDALEDSFGAMLDVSRLDAGVVQPTLQTFPIRDVYRRLHMHCAGQADERGLSLRFKAGGKLVTSDPQLLERILSNLIHNSIRYTHAGGVVVVTRERGPQTSIEVWDTGVGIASENLPKIFDEFYQVENAGRDRTRGLGMGLSIVKRLVLLLAHQLEVKSTPDRGSVFRVLLRRTELAELPSMVLGADTIPAALDEDRTVLVIDDEEAVRRGMNELLSSWGFAVLLAGSIAEACAAVRRHSGVIDVVVSDLRLAGDEDGLQAIVEVRQQYGAPLPALLITGDTSPEQVKRVHESGHAVLFKPVRARDLFSALRRTP